MTYDKHLAEREHLLTSHLRQNARKDRDAVPVPTTYF